MPGQDKPERSRRVRRQLSNVQLALINQSHGWLFVVLEAIPQAERTPEEREMLRLIRLVRKWVLEEFQVH